MEQTSFLPEPPERTYEDISGADWYKKLVSSSVKPYYSDGRTVIFNADSREMLKEIRRIDVVATDPPYGMEYISNHRAKSFSPIKGDEKYDIETLKALIEMGVVATYAFCRWDNIPELPKPKSFIPWVKNNWSMGDLEHEYARQWEGIAFWAGPNHKWASGRPQDVIIRPRENPTEMVHPTQKPVSLLTGLLSHNVCKTVLDPYMGSGTTLVAAKELGKFAVGVEINESYCEAAARRLSQEVFNL